MPNNFHIALIAGILFLAVLALFFYLEKRKKTALDDRYFYRNLQEQKDRLKIVTFETLRKAIKYFQTIVPRGYERRDDLKTWGQEELSTALAEAKSFEQYQVIFQDFDADQDIPMWNVAVAKNPIIISNIKSVVGEELGQLVNFETSILDPVTKAQYYKTAVEISRFVMLGFLDEDTTKTLWNSANSLKQTFK